MSLTGKTKVDDACPNKCNVGKYGIADGKSTEDDALSQKVIPEGKKQRAKNANVSLYSSTSAWEQLLASDKKNIPKHTVRNRALLTTNQIIVDKTSSNGVTL